MGMNSGQSSSRQTNQHSSWREVLVVSSKLGFTSFGGPVAHIGYFHDEYVKRRKWLDEQSYAELVALCQFLPGPASSQIGIGIGVLRAGIWGGVAAWIGFTLPSVIALALFALLLQGFDISTSGWLHGLKLVAVAIVAQAILSMGQKLTPDRSRVTIAILAAVISSVWQTAVSQLIVIVLAGLVGRYLFQHTKSMPQQDVHLPLRRFTAIVSLSVFFLILALLPLLRLFFSSHWLAVFDSFFRTGSLVFGGGHVVLPLLEREVVSSGWVSEEAFLAGYGAAQAVPGPLFTFASYLGQIMGGWLGVTVATLAIFLPAFLLVVGTLPFWNVIRRNQRFQGALAGVNAAVVGLMLAAFYHPIWTGSVQSATDFSLVSILFVLLVWWRWPPWLVVLAGVIGGTISGIMVR